MRAWLAFHRLTPWLRWPLKWLMLATAVGLILFPCVWLLPTYISRMRNLDALIDPNAPELAPLEREVRTRVALRMLNADVGVAAPLAGDIGASPAPSAASSDAPAAAIAATLRETENVVYRHVPYDWDWNTWGVFDYVPTVHEVFVKGHEDCDGRAVVAASLLRRMGIPTAIRCDLMHVWVHTPYGEAMTVPGQGPATVTTPEGGGPTRVNLTPAALANLARGTTFGVWAFPVGRVALLWLAVCLVAAHPRSSRVRRVVGPLVALAGLALVRYAGQNVAYHEEFPWIAVAGWALAAVGLIVLMLRGAVKPRPAFALE